MPLLLEEALQSALEPRNDHSMLSLMVQRETQAAAAEAQASTFTVAT